jgi:hypothetical protein
MDIRWVVDESTTGFYLVAAMLRGRTLVDHALARAFAAIADRWRADAESWHVDPIELMDDLTAATGDRTNHEDRARSAFCNSGDNAYLDRLLPVMLARMHEIDVHYAKANPWLLQNSSYGSHRFSSNGEPAVRDSSPDCRN